MAAKKSSKRSAKKSSDQGAKRQGATREGAKKPHRVPSTRRLEDLPQPTRLHQLTRSLALLDEIMCEDWEGRYYSYSPAWGEGEEMAQMRDSAGNSWFLLFKKAGLVLLGFDHEASPMTPYVRKPPSLWPGLIDGIPDALLSALQEPAFSPPDFTFVIWRAVEDDRYRIGPIEFPERDAIERYRTDPDGSRWLLEIFDDDPSTYTKFATDYYEREVDRKAVAKIYAHTPLTEELILALNEDADVEAILESARAMRYPVAEP